MLEDEPRNPDEDAQQDPTTETSEEPKTIEENLNLISVVNNNPVIISTLLDHQFVAPWGRTQEWI